MHKINFFFLGLMEMNEFFFFLINWFVNRFYWFQIVLDPRGAV